MNKNLTHIAFILDRSGSMSSIAKEAIGSFNAFIEAQIKEPGTAKLSLILFDHEYSPLITSASLDDIPPLTEETYIPRGMTALLDAMGRTIDDLGKELAALPEEERPGQVIVVTLTDGYENSSHDYTHTKVAEMIKHQREAYNWEFIFLGADVESVEYAKTLNVDSQYSQQFDRTNQGVQEAISYSSQHISKRRRRQSPATTQS
ncbi:vWA domain-containing protein [Coraliomargarita sp. W4R53]